MRSRSCEPTRAEEFRRCSERFIARGKHLEALRTKGLTVKSALGDARLEIVEGAGHFVEMEKPEALASLVTRFVTPA